MGEQVADSDPGPGVCSPYAKGKGRHEMPRRRRLIIPFRAARRGQSNGWLGGMPAARGEGAERAPTHATLVGPFARNVRPVPVPRPLPRCRRRLPPGVHEERTRSAPVRAICPAWPWPWPSPVMCKQPPIHRPGPRDGRSMQVHWLEGRRHVGQSAVAAPGR